MNDNQTDKQKDKQSNNRYYDRESIGQGERERKMKKQTEKQ